jgi:hypothetical protein
MKKDKISRNGEFFSNISIFRWMCNLNIGHLIFGLINKLQMSDIGVVRTEILDKYK